MLNTTIFSPQKVRLFNFSAPRAMTSMFPTFSTTCMLGNIGSLIDNLESSLSRKLLPTKCKSCGSSEVLFERLSGYFQSIPVLLTVEIGHLPNMSKTLEISDVNQQLTINHDQRTFHYQLTGFSVHLGNHFYSILCDKGEYYKYDGMLTTGTTTIWNVNHFPGNIKSEP